MWTWSGQDLPWEVVDRHAGNKIQYFIKTQVTHTQRVLTARARERETERESERGGSWRWQRYQNRNLRVVVFITRSVNWSTFKSDLVLLAQPSYYTIPPPIPYPRSPLYPYPPSSPDIHTPWQFSIEIESFVSRFTFGSLQLVPFYWGVLGVCDADRLFALLFIRQRRGEVCVCVWQLFITTD